MRAGSEYLSSNSKIIYPFAHGSAIPDEIKECVVDLSITRTASSSPDFTPYCEEASLDAGVLTVVIAYDDDTFTVTTDPEDTGTGFHEFSSDDGLVSLVIDMDAVHRYSGVTDIVVSDISFDNSVFIPYVTGLDAIHVYTGSEQESVAVVSGDISIKSGYSFSVDSSGNDVTLNALPGAGLGFYPCTCPDDDPPVTDEDDDDDVGTSIQTDTGIVKFENDACYDIVPDVQNGYIVFYHKCVACCPCASYVRQVDRLRELANTVRSAGDNIQASIASHNAAIGNWNSNGSKSSHTGGSYEPRWFTLITALKKNPSVGSIRGKIIIRAVATVSNTTLQSGKLNISSFKCKEANSETEVSFSDVHWFMLGNQMQHGNGLPSDLDVRPGGTVKITGTARLPGTVNQIEASIEGTGGDADVEASVTC